MTWTTGNKYDKAKAELNRLVNLFKSNEFVPTVAKAFITSGGKPSDKWSLLNKITMILNDTVDARGYRQWQEVGRFVSKGSKAFYILGPRTIKEFDHDTGKEETKLIGFIGIPVFRYEDTEGKELPKPEPKQLPPLFDIAKKFGAKVTYQTYDGSGVYGYNTPDGKIVLFTHDPTTFYHELAHQINRQFENITKGPEAEAIAELTSCVLCSLYGFENIGHSWNYIKYYAEQIETIGNNPEKVGRLIAKVLDKVDKILKLLFTEVEKHEAAKVEVGPIVA